jgi:dolichol-phosphate mannosyltransferase
MKKNTHYKNVVDFNCDHMLSLSIAVVIPCYKVKDIICSVISKIGPEVNKIYVVDDCCPENTGDYVNENCFDNRIVIIKSEINLGVGGAVKLGYLHALNDSMDIVVKIDGDGQMDPGNLIRLIMPIVNGDADYSKGNRFYDLERISSMPKFRLFGNAVLSFVNKFSSGYWNIFDPTNGYTAIHSDLLKCLPLAKINNRFFFETDMLFRLNTFNAVVIDIPMHALYGDEKSNLIISKIFNQFIYKHFANFFKRIFYNYYLRDMSLASFQLPVGIGLLLFGLIFGFSSWRASSALSQLTPAGTVMISGISVLIGIQFLLAFLAYDIQSVPKKTFHQNKRFIIIPK